MAKVGGDYRLRGGDMDHTTFELLQFPYVWDRKNDAPTAREIADARSAYDQLQKRMGAVLRDAAATIGLGNAADEILDSIKVHLDNCLLPGETRPPVVPLLSTHGVGEFINRIDSVSSQLSGFEKANLGVQMFAAYLYEVRAIWSVERAPDQMLFAPNVLAELNSYTAWKIGIDSKKSESDIFGLNFLERQRLNYITNEVETLLDEQRGRVGNLAKITEEAKLHVDDVVQRVNIDTGVVHEKLSGMERSLEASTSELSALLKRIETAEEHVKSFAKAIREELQVDATKRLWNRRALGSAFSFWTSALVIGGAILLPPYWAFTHIEVVVEFLRRIGDAAVQGLPNDATAAQLTAATISRLVIVSAPLALYFWAIKLIVRFNTRSMVLMDDARQRQTTMDTYFHLVENNKATPEERGLMLNALFKPLPGQGQDNVDPPNFMELVKKPE